MTAADIDAYLARLDEPHGSTLGEVRRRVVALLPQAEQVISYQVPGFRVEGKMIAGLAAFTRHLSYLPHSGSVLPALADELAGYQGTKSALHFPVDEPLPVELIRRLLQVRLDQAGLSDAVRLGERSPSLSSVTRDSPVWRADPLAWRRIGSSSRPAGSPWSRPRPSGAMGIGMTTVEGAVRRCARSYRAGTTLGAVPRGLVT